MTQPKRIAMTLARPLVNRGRELQPGDQVQLLPRQIEDLEPQGYFQPRDVDRPAKPAKEGRR